MEIKTIQWINTNCPGVSAATRSYRSDFFKSLKRVLIFVHVLEVMFGFTLLEPGYMILYQQQSLMTEMEVIFFKKGPINITI